MIYNRLTQQVNQTSSLDYQKSQLLEREKEVKEVTKEIQKLKEDTEFTDPINNIHNIRKQIVNSQPTTTGKEIVNSAHLYILYVCVYYKLLFVIKLN